jgi:hypothetical protein
MDEALKDLWQAAVPDLLGAEPGERGTGLYKYWRENRQRLGSPVGPERNEDGRVYQAFASGVIVRWDDSGPREV